MCGTSLLLFSVVVHRHIFHVCYSIFQVSRLAPLTFKTITMPKIEKAAVVTPCNDEQEDADSLEQLSSSDPEDGGTDNDGPRPLEAAALQKKKVEPARADDGGDAADDGDDDDEDDEAGRVGSESGGDDDDEPGDSADDVSEIEIEDLKCEACSDLSSAVMTLVV